jgi:uncharacterized protein (TIGR03790 family)
VVWVFATALLLLFASGARADVSADTPKHPGLSSQDIAVIINTEDPLSVEVGNYYIAKRHIKQTNVARVRFEYQRDEIRESEFAAVKASADKQLDPHVQAYALTWARPYRVGCMSITSAFAFGFDARFCATGCKPTIKSPYFNSRSSRPYDDLHMRPAMSLAAADFQHAKALIDRGVRADGTLPRGTAYLVATDDTQRNVRATREYPLAAAAVANRPIRVESLTGPGLQDRPDVLFYFIGAENVPTLSSNHFLPGAVGDHLTSFGGMLTDSTQMSSLRWLEAGATGSYGTVVEPCNFPGKFPHVAVLMADYLAGQTLIEAYWKSVQMPGQGLFIGEPLSDPFRRRALP